MSKEKNTMLFEQFESDVMQKILCEIPEMAEVLLKQYESAIVLNREFTGCGFFTKYQINDEYLSLKQKKNIELGSVEANINNVQDGVGFVLYIRNGFIDSLEGYTYGEPWPEVLTEYSIT